MFIFFAQEKTFHMSDSATQATTPTAQSEQNTVENTTEKTTGATFELDADDPRRTDNRGGLEATQPTNEGATAPSNQDDSPIASDDGTTSADVSKTGPVAAHDVGANSGTIQSGKLDMQTTGLVSANDGVPGVGPREGSQSGASAPQVEVTDIGLIDVNSTDVSVLAEPTDGDEDTNA